MSGTHGLDNVKVLSRIAATFSVELCEKSDDSPVCQPSEAITIHVVGMK